MEKSLLILAILLKTFAVTTVLGQSQIVSFNNMPAAAPQQLSVCLDAAPEGGANTFVLLPSINGQQVPTPASTTIDFNNCITFDGDLPSHKNELAHFVLNTFFNDGTSIDPNPIKTLEAEFTIPVFPVVTAAQKAENPDQGDSSNPHILRIEGTMSTFTFDGAHDIYKNSADTVTYYFGDFGSSDITPCDSVNTDPKVCDSLLTIDSTPAITADITVESGILKYAEPVNADATITIGITPMVTQKKIDIIFKGQLPADSGACTGDLTNVATCDITWTPGITQADIRIVTLDDTDAMTDYIKNPIQDHNLAVGAISDSTVEGRWEKVGIDKFQLIALNSDSTEAGKIEVDCVNLNVYCLGYVIGLETTTKTYTMKLQDIDTTLSKYRDDSQIESTATTITPPADIRDIQMDWYQKDEHIRARVCFNHTAYDVRTEFSHYEFLLINTRGQWIKHALRTAKAGVHCFSPYTISPADFDVSEGPKLIVMQRAMDQFTVLASGETDVF